MTLEHDLLQLARDAMRALMNGRNFGTGQTGHYLNIIRRIEDELNRPQPEFDTPESHIVKWSIPVDPNNFGEPLAQPEQAAVPFPSFMRKRIEEAMDLAIKPKSMSVHDGKAKVLVSDLHRMLLVIDSVPPRKEWVGLTDEERNEMINKIQHDQFTRQRDLIGSTQIITEMYLKDKNA